MDDAPTITILLLGDHDVGKSTFLSRLTQPTPKGAVPPPPYILRDEDQPFVFNARFGERVFRLEFYDTATPGSYHLLKPDVFVLCYDVSRKASLRSVKENWFRQIHLSFRPPSETPILLVGLRRDLREKHELRGEIVLPDEAYALAQDLRLDRYLECSAVTGELMREVLEDIAEVAARTTMDGGGATQGGCCVM